jgi:uncharacterized glyoxalase superfamily protein PhnB
MSELTPYLCVADSRAAITWYDEVFQATLKDQPYVMDDGRVGHVELMIGDARLMMADPFPEVDVEPRPGAWQRRHVASGSGGLRLRGCGGGTQWCSPGPRP